MSTEVFAVCDAYSYILIMYIVHCTVYTVHIQCGTKTLIVLSTAWCFSTSLKTHIQ